MAEFLGGYDRRTRRVILLAGAAAIAVLGAAVTLSSTAKREAPAFERRAFFPDLGDRLQDVARLEIVSAEDTITVERDGDGGWIVPQKDGYPADIRPLREVFEGLRGLEILSPKTANAGWHSHLELKAPEQDGKAVKLRLTDADGAEIAALLVGKDDETGEVSGRNRFHARKPGENQTWLVTGRIARETNPASWLDTGLLDVDRDVIHSARIVPAEGDAYTVSRPNADAIDYSLDALPEGRETRSTFVVNGVATAIAGLDFEDVMAREGLPTGEDDAEPAPLATATFRTFDGLVLDVTQFAGEGEEERWVALAARVEPPMVQETSQDSSSNEPSTDADVGDADAGDADAGDAKGSSDAQADEQQAAEGAASDAPTTPEDPVAEEAAEDMAAEPRKTAVISAEVGAMVNRINRLAEGRVFKIASYSAEQMAKPLEDLLTPLETPADAPATDPVEDPEVLMPEMEQVGGAPSGNKATENNSEPDDSDGR